MHDRILIVKRAIQSMKNFHRKSIHILPIPGGSLTDSELVNGIVFKRTFTYAGFEQQPKMIRNPKILLLNHEVCTSLNLLNFKIELKHQKEFARLVINSPTEYHSFVDTEWQLLYRKLDQIYKTKCNVILDIQVRRWKNANWSKPIGDLATQHFVQKEITNISRIPKDLMEKISKIVGGKIQASLEDLSDETIFGHCELFEERTIGDDRYCILSGCPNAEQVTLILRGASDEILKEV